MLDWAVQAFLRAMRSQLFRAGIRMSSLLSSHPLLCRLASASWRHPGFAPYWPLLRRLRQMAWDAAGRPDMTAWQETPSGQAGWPGRSGQAAGPEQAEDPGQEGRAGDPRQEGRAGGPGQEGRAGGPDGALSGGGPDGTPALPFMELPPETWDTAHWLPFMNRLAAWRGLRNSQGVPLRFVAGSDVGAVDYECSIREGQIPCKLHAEGARHDFHNALVWQRFPRLKAAINQLHCEQAARDAAAVEAASMKPRGRGPLRDALTLLDENGALWPQPHPLWEELLAGRQWHALFVEQRQALLGSKAGALENALEDSLKDPAASVMMNAGIRGGALGSHAPVIVGHGLLEKLHQPYKSMTAKLLACPEPRYSIDWGTARQLLALAKEGNLRPGLLQPLPVQGWPGWDTANADPAYYADEQVFRGLRRV